MHCDRRSDSPGVIFDLDGTLADTLADIADSINHILAEIGHEPASRERIRSCIGEGLPILLQRVSGIVEPATIASLVDRYRPIYQCRLLRQTRLYPGIDSVLDALVCARVPMSVLSNKPHEFTDPICGALLRRWPFVRSYGWRDGSDRKPEPTTALELAALMQRASSDVYFVGDSSTDIHTARNAGMIPVAVTWGYRDLQELEAAGATYYLDQPRQLTELIL